MTRFFLLTALMLMLNGCDDLDDLVDSIGGSGDDDPPPAQELALIKPPVNQEPVVVQAEPAARVNTAPKVQIQPPPKVITAPEAQKEANPKPEKKMYETRFHHTTTGSSDGGKSLVLCPGQNIYFDRCATGNTPIPLHGRDEGRVIYWNMRAEPRGDIVCTKNGKTYRYKADRPVLFGSCR